MENGKLSEKMKEFKNAINRTVLEIISLQNVEEEMDIYNLILIQKDSDLFYEFLFFTNYQKIIILKCDFDCDNYNLLFKQFSKMKIYNNENNLYNNLFQTIFHMHLFFLIKIESTISSIYENLNYDFKEIKYSYIIIIQIANLLFKLYQEKIYNINKILLFFDAIIILINKQSIISDRYLKLKNKILFDLLFDKFYLQFLKLILSRNDANIDEIKSILNYLIKALQNKKMKSYFNYSLLINIYIFEKIIKVLCSNIIFLNNPELYKEYKNKIIDCFSDIYKNNTNNSNFLEILIKQNKNAFVNLMNFETKKEFISNDINIQNFYLEILNNIFSKEKVSKKEKKEIIYMEDFFVFNGHDSEMFFYLRSFSLDNSMIIFSFKINQDIYSSFNSIFPLIIFETSDTNDIIFEILIKKENNIIKLYLYQDKKKEDIKKEICLEKIQKLSIDITYYLVIKFEETKAKIYISGDNQEKFYEDKEIFEINKNPLNVNIKIGNDEQSDKNITFKGCIGPLLIMKNLKIENNLNIDNIINSILDLKNIYHFLPFFLSKESTYNYSNYFVFSSIQEKINFINNKTNLQNSIKSFECSLYITPEIINIYYSLFLKNEKESNFPSIPNTIIIPDNYKIVKMNLSTIIRRNILTEFLNNNGFDYFILIYEYFYQLFNIILQNKNELNCLLNNDKAIKESIKATLIILSNYSFYRFIVTNQKKFKTLFRNLYDMLIYSNKISDKIFPGISEEFYDLFFTLKGELNLLQNYINIIPDSQDYINDVKILSDFYNGLLDMIYSHALYENFKGESYLNVLFKKTKSFYFEYMKEKNVSKIIPFEFEHFLKIVRLSKILEKSSINDYKNKNSVINSFFGLLKSLLNSMESKKRKIYFKNLFVYVINNNKNNLLFALSFLNFIYEMPEKNFSFNNETIEVLLNYCYNIYNSIKEDDNEEIIENINMSISSIIIRFYIYYNWNEYKKYFIDFFEKINKFNIILSNIIIILLNLFNDILKTEDEDEESCFLVEINDKADYIDYMFIFEKSFDFIINLFNITINKIKKEEVQNEQNIIHNNDIIENDNIKQLLDLLIKMQKKIESELSKNIKNKNCIYYLINYIKFYHYITIEQGHILQYTEKAHIDNIIKIIDLASEYNFINTFQKFEVMYNFKDEKKTIIEMIFELTMNIFLNDKNNNEIYRCLVQNYNFIFFIRDIEGKNSIFYATDIMRYYNLKKNQKLDKYSNKKENLIFFNDLFQNKDKFDGLFTNYFLASILKYQIKFSKKTFINAPISQLNSFLDELISIILEEHRKLYKLDKKFFFKKKFLDTDNFFLKYMKKNFIKKEASINDLKTYFGSYLEKLKSEKNDKEMEDEVQINKEVKNIKKSNSKDEIIIDKNIFDNNTNKIRYIYDYDEYYVTNFKKEYMNSIFSLYYLDEFFYDEDFCKVKKFYLENFITNENYIESKQLNFPTRIKHFRNNFEPPLFLKKFKNFVIDPYFPITHSYIDKINKNSISLKKSINLKKKVFLKPKIINEIECEIIRDEVAHFGKIMYNEQKKYLLFKEEEKNFSNVKGYKYIFLLSFMNTQNKDLLKGPDGNNLVKTYDKHILILKDEIEEIVEMRIFLLWKGCEIFLKNGKSYLFNFLTTDEYNNFIKNVYSDKIKIVSRKKDFLNDRKNIIKLYEKNSITKDWKEGIISNYEYLLFLNRYSSRSFQDPTQYPVFPWILNDYKNLEILDKEEKTYLKVINEIEAFQDKQKEDKINNDKMYQIDNIILDELNESLKNKYKSRKIFFYNECKEIFSNIQEKINNFLRDFNYFPTLQNIKKRIKAKQKYESDEGIFPFPYHCGNHYSTSGYIYFYLMRQQPYDNSLVKLQGFNLENTNRCFININNILKIANVGMDNRELIPELFSRTEYFFNLNCDSYGISSIKDNYYLDDCIIDFFSGFKTHLPKYVNFIIKSKKLLNSNIIGFQLKKWIDIIFGVKQLPKPEERKDSLVILSEYSYEENINLENILNEALKEQQDEKEIKNDIANYINLIINFGVVPARIFNSKHPKLKQKKEKINNEIKENKIFENDLFENEGLEKLAKENVLSQNLKFRIWNTVPVFFKKNSTNNKIFIYNKNGQIQICDCQLFNRIYYSFFDIFKFQFIENSYISCYGKNALYQIKYSFSSFDSELENISDEPEAFHTYYFRKINYFINKYKIENEIKKKKHEIIKILTCRHYDFSFKIYYYIKINNKKDIISKTFSYICEDFVTSCACMSSNSFAIGLNNGKLICFKIISSNYSYNAKNIIQSIENIKIRRERYIQAHQGKINVIEIDKRLGIIITTGDDNYIFIRKLYDLELLLPIKIKKKYSILMLKISSYNFIYILCYNQLNDKKRIFGYTLSGIRFAKSEYGSYDNINFSDDGNLITFDQKTENNIIILSGSDLTKITDKNYDKEAIDEIKKIKPVKWIEYDCFFRRGDEKLNKIITFFDEEKEKKFSLKTLNLSDLNK